MIDITVDNNEVEIENDVYHSLNHKETLTALIADVIDKAKYSGESITLWQAYIDDGKEMKRLIKEW